MPFRAFGRRGQILKTVAKRGPPGSPDTLSAEVTMGVIYETGGNLETGFNARKQRMELGARCCDGPGT